jgi:hypothetical protein
MIIYTINYLILLCHIFINLCPDLKNSVQYADDIIYNMLTH